MKSENMSRTRRVAAIGQGGEISFDDPGYVSRLTGVAYLQAAQHL